MTALFAISWSLLGALKLRSIAPFIRKKMLVKVRLTYYKVKCKRCGNVLETELSEWQFTSGTLKEGRAIECPRCHNVNNFKADGFFT